jgi:hypothetical protein
MSGGSGYKRDQIAAIPAEIEGGEGELRGIWSGKSGRLIGVAELVRAIHGGAVFYAK